MIFKSSFKTCRFLQKRARSIQFRTSRIDGKIIRIIFKSIFGVVLYFRVHLCESQLRNDLASLVKEIDQDTSFEKLCCLTRVELTKYIESKEDQELEVVQECLEQIQFLVQIQNDFNGWQCDILESEWVMLL